MSRGAEKEGILELRWNYFMNIFSLKEELGTFSLADVFFIGLCTEVNLQPSSKSRIHRLMFD